MKFLIIKNQLIIDYFFTDYQIQIQIQFSIIEKNYFLNINYIMNRIYFIIILIMFLVFFKYNIRYEKHHNDKSILNESDVKKTIKDASMIDDLYRIIETTSILAA